MPKKPVEKTRTSKTPRPPSGWSITPGELKAIEKEVSKKVLTENEAEMLANKMLKSGNPALVNQAAKFLIEFSQFKRRQGTH